MSVRVVALKNIWSLRICLCWTGLSLEDGPTAVASSVCLMDNTQPLSLSSKQKAAQTAVSLNAKTLSLSASSRSGPTAAPLTKTNRNTFIYCCIDVSALTDFPVRITQQAQLSIHLFSVYVWFGVFFLVLSPSPVAATSARRCHSIYKGFAQCLMALGDSLTDSARKDEDTHEIHSICRSVYNTQIWCHI